MNKSKNENKKKASDYELSTNGDSRVWCVVKWDTSLEGKDRNRALRLLKRRYAKWGATCYLFFNDAEELLTLDWKPLTTLLETNVVCFFPETLKELELTYHKLGRWPLVIRRDLPFPYSLLKKWIPSFWMDNLMMSWCERKKKRLLVWDEDRGPFDEELSYHMMGPGSICTMIAKDGEVYSLLPSVQLQVTTSP